MPALKAVLTSLDGLDEATAKLYTKGSDGKYTLDVDGLVDKSKLDEFRSTNVELKKKIDEMQEQLAKFSGIDLQKYNDAMKSIESDAEKKLLKDGKIDEVIQLRTEKMRQTFDEQLKAKDQIILKANKDRETAVQQMNTHIVESELRRSVDNPDFGFQTGVVDLLRQQVLSEFAVKDGKVVRVKADGTPVFGAKGDPATIDEFLQDIVKDRPYLVRSSSGGGARNDGGGTNGQKTMKRSEFDGIHDPIRKAKVAREVTIVD